MTARVVQQRTAASTVVRGASTTATVALGSPRRGPPSAISGVPDAIPLGEVLRRAGAAVRDGMPDPVWVVAAVTAVKAARGGCSIELVEPDVARSDAGILRAYMPDAILTTLAQRVGLAVAVDDLVGMTITVRLSVELSPRWGLSGRVHALAPGLEASLARRALDAALVRLGREGLLDRQARLAVPRDVTRVAVVHPAGAAGWADIAADLARWAAAGLIAFRSVPAPFEGASGAPDIAAALRRAAQPIEGHAPDVVLVIRGGGAAASLGALDTEIVARAVATSSMPVITGLGHAIDRTLADHVAWRSVDTPSKALALVSDLMVGPARRARADHAAVLTAVSAGVDRALPRLAASERLATAEALRQAVAASERLDRTWAKVREAAEAARGRLARLDDGIERLVVDIARASPLLVGRTTAELEALMEAIRARARRAGEGAAGGARHLAVAAERAVSLIDTAAVELATLNRIASAAAAAQVDRASVEMDGLARTIRERSRGQVTGADDGSRALVVVETAISDTHRAQDAAIARLRQAIEVALSRRLDAAAAALDRALDALDGADPANVLHQGYALVMDGHGRAITSVAAARAATSLVLTFADGAIAVRPTRPQPETGDRS